jgi:hypothetical protein
MSKPRLLTPAELDALELILPLGSENGTSQRTLSATLGWDAKGRKVRQGFQQLRRDRHVKVVALTTDKGCFIARDEDLDALKHNADAMHSRAMSVLVTEKDLREMIADIEWNPALFAVN